MASTRTARGTQRRNAITMMGGYGSGMGAGGWVLMGLFWILLLALIFWAVVRLLPRSDRADRPAEGTPEEILDRRFASGELDVETYQVQRNALAAARGNRK
jgi:putative membrane protein